MLPKAYTCVILLHVYVVLEKNMVLEDCINCLCHMNHLCKFNLMRGRRAHSALGMQLIGWCLKCPPPLRHGRKHCKPNVSKGNSLIVHSLCGSAAPSKLFVHVCTRAVRNDDFQLVRVESAWLRTTFSEVVAQSFNSGNKKSKYTWNSQCAWRWRNPTCAKCTKLRHLTHFHLKCFFWERIFWSSKLWWKRARPVEIKFWRGNKHI